MLLKTNQHVKRDVGGNQNQAKIPTDRPEYLENFSVVIEIFAIQSCLSQDCEETSVITIFLNIFYIFIEAF